jgi:ferric-dicitrate binding protein FerR (iron transport regulator)
MNPALNARILRSLFAIAASAVGASLLTPVGAARAAEQVGVAVTVRNDVTGKLQTQTVKIEGGSNVFGREIVRTNLDSNAKIVLKDSTNLSVGPNSSVTLDNFVFQGDSDYKQAGFNLAKGAFRFTSGGSDKRAYELKTPTAVIGVRGTDFSADVGEKTTHIEVKVGRILVCPRNRKVEANASDKESRRRGCAFVNEGEAVNVSENSVTPSSVNGEAAQAACGGACDAPTSYTDALQSTASLGSTGLPIEAIAIGLGAAGAAAGGAVAGSNNGHHNNGGGDYYPRPISGY